MVRKTTRRSKVRRKAKKAKYKVRKYKRTIKRTAGAMGAAGLIGLAGYGSYKHGYKSGARDMYPFGIRDGKKSPEVKRNLTRVKNTAYKKGALDAIKHMAG